MAWIRAMGNVEKPFLPTGLTAVVGRASIVSGGWRKRGGYIEVDITVQILDTLGTANGIVTGFPAAASTGAVTPNVNNLQINYNGNTCTLQTVTTQPPATLHFTGSYLAV